MAGLTVRRCRICGKFYRSPYLTLVRLDRGEYEDIDWKEIRK